LTTLLLPVAAVVVETKPMALEQAVAGLVVF
jgi:hypothetical protein